jgi:hypothetical protein
MKPKGLALIFTITAILIYLPTFAATAKQTTPDILKQFAPVKVQFDVKRVVFPSVLQYAKTPQTWRAYLPTCPAGSTYVSGVNPNMVQLDAPPNYPYCNCICNGNCGGLPGISVSGRQQQPIYTATVTCSVTVAQTGNAGIQPNISPDPHQYTYCQAGSCTTNPLPASVNYSVPVGGYSNTIKIDFVACPLAVESGCGTPDPISISRV